MLILSRELDEKVIITVPGFRPIVVTFVGHKSGHGIRLGFDAPPEITIHREEVQRDIDAGREWEGRS